MYLRNVHPSKSFNFHQASQPSFSSQEPRRPRFSFFNLHNVKEPTSLPKRARTSSENSVSTFFEGTRSLIRLPGRSSALSEAADQWERQALASSTFAGCTRDVSVCQHPISDLRFDPKLENLKPRIALPFQWFAALPATRWRRALQRWAGYRVEPCGCKLPIVTKTTFAVRAA